MPVRTVIDRGPKVGRRWPIVIGVVILAFAAILVLRKFGYVPLIDGPEMIHNQASLPDRIHVCRRSWDKDGLDRIFTLGGIRGDFGIDPVIADPRFFAPCPAGACTSVASDGPCHTVIFVRVGDDAYVDYSLSGGP